MYIQDSREPACEPPWLSALVHQCTPGDQPQTVQEWQSSPCSRAGHWLQARLELPAYSKRLALLFLGIFTIFAGPIAFQTFDPMQQVGAAADECLLPCTPCPSPLAVLAASVRSGCNPVRLRHCGAVCHSQTLWHVPVHHVGALCLQLGLLLGSTKLGITTVACGSHSSACSASGSGRDSPCSLL